MERINVGVIGTGWCGGIRAETAADSPFVNELHIAENRPVHKAGIPAGRINSVAEALETEQAKARRMVETVDHPKLGPIKLLGTPFKFSGTPTSIRRHPPTHGENTEEVLANGFGTPAAKSKSSAA